MNTVILRVRMKTAFLMEHSKPSQIPWPPDSKFSEYIDQIEQILQIADRQSFDVATGGGNHGDVRR